MTRLARALAVIAWAASLALPAAAPARAHHAPIAELCSAGSAGAMPAAPDDPGRSTECPCCISFGSGVLPSAPAGAFVGHAVAPRPAVRTPEPIAATAAPLPPARGPPA